MLYYYYTGMVIQTVRKIAEPRGTYPYRRSLKDFLRKRAMLLHEHVAAVNVVYSEAQSSETVKYFWNEYSPHLVFRNPNKQIFSTARERGPTGIKVCFESGRHVFLDGDEDYVNPKPISQLVAEFVKVAGCNEVEYRERVAPDSETSWTTPGARCVCDIRGQCPCPRMVDLPHVAYHKPIEHGPRDTFGRVYDFQSMPEGTTQIFVPKNSYFMIHDKPKKY